MGVYIKGMEMPRSCQSCFANEYQVCIFTDSNAAINEKLPDCPLVPVPEHGRLIDADALMLAIQEYIDEYSEIDEQGLHNEKWCAMKEATMSIEDTPTIIPADKEGER